MLIPYAMQTICEILVAAFVIWAVFNEQKFVNFENKIIAKWKARKLKR